MREPNGIWYMERALAVYEQVLGPTHPDTALSLNNLGALLQAQGEPAAARPLYERALAIAENVLGSAHPHTQIFCGNLERLIAAMDDNEPPTDPPAGAM
jgi:tetratricopeptide (TPR) repeat protein